MLPRKDTFSLCVLYFCLPPSVSNICCRLRKQLCCRLEARLGLLLSFLGFSSEVAWRTEEKDTRERVRGQGEGNGCCFLLRLQDVDKKKNCLHKVAEQRGFLLQAVDVCGASGRKRERRLRERWGRRVFQLALVTQRRHVALLSRLLLERVFLIRPLSLSLSFFFVGGDCVAIT